ncbi:phosphoribosyltransferase-like protein [Thalassospira xiamenensis]|uniref:phosphoribosyltransferase-like protein n=1 Tax=Thalassospira xiamenensis TaxID=220697 RepID=UPI001FFE574A|nr:hypothetical protein [Thalassospira xiamenensis]MCK2167158.1 hypothetical protein [Thalassospira xiamenensis]
MNMQIWTVNRLKSIFERNGWSADGVMNDEIQKRFNTIGEILDQITVEEAELVLTLLQDFKKIDYLDYIAYLQTAFFSVPQGTFLNVRSVAVGPIVSKKDREKGKNKSGLSLPYSFINLILKKNLPNGGVAYRDFVYIDNFINNNYDNSDLVIVLDDYIGTGDTALEFLEEFESRSPGVSQKLIVISVFAHSIGIDRLREEGYRIFFGDTQRRGISDSTRLSNVDVSLDLMRNIENNLKVDPDFELGYGRSEGLVSLVRTPNNTFPVFWIASKKDKTSWPAPFPR